MTQLRAAQVTGQKCLVWALLVAVTLMGLTITTQQTLGSLHNHTDHETRTVSVLSIAVSGLVNGWLSRWQQQKAYGHSQLRPIQSGSAPAHSHDTLERHHHAANDASVNALDGAAELADATDSPAGGATGLLIGVWAACTGLAFSIIAAHNGDWPLWRFFAFASRTVPPLLRPPSI